jgi:hypothetical protein
MRQIPGVLDPLAVTPYDYHAVEAALISDGSNPAGCCTPAHPSGLCHDSYGWRRTQ